METSDEGQGKAPLSTKEIVFFILLSLIVLSLLLPGNIYQGLYAHYVKDYLPLLTPLILSIVSFLIRAREAEGKTSVQSITIDLTLGVVSFDVWALTSMLTSPQKIAQLTPTRILDQSDVIICLLLGFGLLAVCFWAGTKQEGDRLATPLRTWFALGLAIVAFFVPTKIASDQALVTIVKPPDHEFRVVVPYLDNSLRRQIGNQKWGQRLMCEPYSVRAKDASDAKSKALQLFQDSPLSQPMFAKWNSSVEAVAAKVLAEKTAE